MSVCVYSDGRGHRAVLGKTYIVNLHILLILMMIFIFPGEASGKPTVHATGCSSHVGDVDVKFHGGDSWLLNLFRDNAEDAVEDAINKMVQFMSQNKCPFFQLYFCIKFRWDCSQLSTDYLVLPALY